MYWLSTPAGLFGGTVYEKESDAVEAMNKLTYVIDKCKKHGIARDKIDSLPVPLLNIETVQVFGGEAPSRPQILADFAKLLSAHRNADWAAQKLMELYTEGTELHAEYVAMKKQALELERKETLARLAGAEEMVAKLKRKLDSLG